MSRILVVDDEPAIGWSLRQVLGDEGHTVEVAASVETALETCRRFVPDALLLDVRLPGRDGIDALPDLRALAPDARVIVMTAFGDLATAVRAMDGGAFDYLVKPFDLARVSGVVTRALAMPTTPSAPPEPPAGDVHLVGTSAPMQDVFKRIALAAPTDLPVLITGPTGTGKELAARAIHAHSPRRDRPFLATSLAARATGVIESELFGHIRGAFTDAAGDRAGLFEVVAGGTLFLDEIGEAPPDVQAKLLRALEAREITPVGAAMSRPIDVRVVAATNRDLDAAVAAGTFRGDLFHRLNGFPITMPALAARLDDLPALVEWFLARGPGPRPPVTPEFLAALRAHPWPGNVRELKHAVAYAAVVSRGAALSPEHLPPTSPAGRLRDASRPLADRVREAVHAWLADQWPADPSVAGNLHERLLALVETALVEEAVRRTDGNRTAAARLLGLDRATLRAKLER